MNENKPICKACARKAKAQGYLVHHLPPYLLKRGWQDKKEPCDICKVGMGWEFWVFDRESDERR